MEFHERLIHAMTLRGRKQADLARDLNMSAGGISMLVGGKRNPSEPMLRTLSDYLSISYVWLKTGEGEMEPVPVEDDTPGQLVARYRKGSMSTKILLRALAELDDDWYEKIMAAIRKCEAEYATEQGEGESE